MTPPTFQMPAMFQEKPHRALLEVWWTGNLLRRAARRLFSGLEGSEAQFNIMLVLRDSPGPLTQHDVAQLLFS